MHSLVSIETYCPTGVRIFPTILIQNVRFLQSISGTINIFDLLENRFSLERGIKHLSDLFFENGSHIPWSKLKDLHSIPSTQYFTWMQVLDAIPDDWKILLKGNGEHTTNDLISSASNHKILINNRLGDVNKLTSKEIYRHLIEKISTQPTAQKMITAKLQAIHGKEYVIDWPGVYMLPRRVTMG